MEPLWAAISDSLSLSTMSRCYNKDIKITTIKAILLILL